MRIALVDDEITQLRQLQQLLSAELYTLMRNSSHKIDTFSSGEDFLRRWEKGSYDVIILDIFMGGLTGVEVAKQIRQTDADVKLAFFSRSNEFAAESYQVNAQYYLLKPATMGSVSNMVKRLNLDLMQQQKMVTLPDGHVVLLRQILFTEYYNHVVYVHLKGGQVHRLRTNHTTMEELLMPCGYIFSPSKGLLLNFYEITQMTDNSAVMSDGTTLPISRRKSKEFASAYTKFRFQKMQMEVDVS